MNVASCQPDVSGSRTRRWPAHLCLRAQLESARGTSPRRTIIRRERGFGPLLIQRTFHPEGAPAHVVLLHPPGGCVGGDTLAVDARVDAGAHALFTSVAATKSYRCEPGATVGIRQHLKVAEGGCLEWLPNEMIAFGGTRLASQTVLDMEPGARCFFGEVLCLGRPASGDQFATGVVDASVRVRRIDPGTVPDGGAMPWFADRQRLAAGAAVMDADWGLAGRRVLGLLCAAPVDVDGFALVRAQLNHWSDDLRAGASLCDGLLVVRWLGRSAAAVVDALRSAWACLRPLVLQRPACRPRIWLT